MKSTRLRQFAKQFGSVELFLAGVFLVFWHRWIKLRVALLACLVGLGASAYALNLYDHPSAFRHGHQLYLGHRNAEHQIVPMSVEQQILENWEEGGRTAEVRRLIREFALAIKRQDRVGANHLCNQMIPLFRPDRYAKEDGKWTLSVAVGQIYLEQGWLDEADREFLSVLSGIPPAKPEERGSYARKIAAYGLSRTNALRGNYAMALKWLAQAPGEISVGCGNAMEAEADRNYPEEVVWAIAIKPFPVAVTELTAVMKGQFKARESSLNGDTSEEQRQGAASEAGLMLGGLYEKAGRLADAEACWSLVAANEVLQPNASSLAKVMLRRLRHSEL